jgi:Mn2+/Fe2+ NRAMP family transporter
MLERLSRYAVRLRPLTPGLGIALAVLALVVAIAIFNPKIAGLQTALPALITALLWVLCVLVFIQVFASVPAPPDASLQGWSRLVRRINRGFHWLLFAALALITAAAVMVTMRLIGDAFS